MTTTDLIVLVLYFLVVAVVGIVSARMVHNREDFLLGGRRFGKTLMVLFTFGSGTHADSAVGVAAQSYRYGLAGIWYQWVMLLTLPIYWLLAPVFRRARVQTTAEFFERRFGVSFMYFYAAFALFICVAYTSVMLYGSARLIESLTDRAITWQWALLLAALVAFLYGTLGGLIAAVWNDLFQGTLTIIMSLMIFPFFWTRIGGLKGFQASLPNASEHLQLVLQEDMTVFWIIMMSINMLISMVAQPHIMANAGAAKTEMDSRVGFVGGVLLKRIMTVPWALAGVMAIALFGTNAIEADHAFGAVAHELLPNGFVGLMVACVMASVMDSSALMMLTFAGIYTNSIHVRLIGSSSSETRLVRVSRWAAICFAVLCIGMAYTFNDVPAAMRFLWKTVPPMGIPFFLGLFWRRANSWGAFASVFGALAAVLVAEYAFGWTGDAGLPKLILLFLCVGVVSGIVVSLISPPDLSAKIDAFLLMLRTPIGHEEVLRKAGMVQVTGTATYELPQLAEVDRAQLRPHIPESVLQESRRQSRYGFGAMTAIVLAMLGGVMVLANWLSSVD